MRGTAKRLTFAHEVERTWMFADLCNSGNLTPDPTHCFDCGLPFSEGDRVVLMVASRDASKLPANQRRVALQLAHADCGATT